MFDREDQRKPAVAYLGSNMMALKPDYGRLQFNTIEEVANYELPVKIGKTLAGEDVYQMKPFLKLHREPMKIKEVFTRNNEESKPIIQQPVLASNQVWNDERPTIASIIEHLRPYGVRSNINREIPEEFIGPLGLQQGPVPRMGGGKIRKRTVKKKKKNKSKH